MDHTKAYTMSWSNPNLSLLSDTLQILLDDSGNWVIAYVHIDKVTRQPAETHKQVSANPAYQD